MSATPERRRRMIESRERVTFEGGTPEGRERLREARERVRGQRERQARELRQEVAERAREQGLNVSEQDVRVTEDEGEIRAEVREEALEREQERAEDEAREQAREQALEAAEQQGLDVSREDIQVQEEDGEFVARVEGDPAAEGEQPIGETAETQEGRFVESLTDRATRTISRFSEGITAAVGGDRREAGEIAQEFTLPQLRAESPEAAADRLRLPEDQQFDEAVPAPIREQIAPGTVEVATFGEAEALTDLGIRAAEDVGAIAEPTLRAASPVVSPTGEGLEQQRREVSALPEQTTTVASRTAEFAQEQPLRFGSQLATGAVLSAGATGAASRAGVIPESVQRLPTAGEVAGEGVRRGARFTTEAGRRAVERAAPVLRRELEATPIDVERFEPLTTRREMVGSVFRQPTPSVTFREVDVEMARDVEMATGEATDVTPDVIVRPGGERLPGDPEDAIVTERIPDSLQVIETPEGRTITTEEVATDVQATREAFLGEGEVDLPTVAELEGGGADPVTARLVGRTEQIERGRLTQIEVPQSVSEATLFEAGMRREAFEVPAVTQTRGVRSSIEGPQIQEEAFLEGTTRAFVAEYTPARERPFEPEGTTLPERGEVGERAQIGAIDYGGGEQLVVEAARGQTALPEVVVDVVEPGVARRLVGGEPRVEVRGEPGTGAMQAATEEVLGDIETRFGEILSPTRAETRGERAELQLFGGEGRQVGEVETVTPEEAAREAIEQTEPRFIEPETPTERPRTDFDTDDGAPGGFRFDFGALGVSPVVEPDAPATGILAGVEADGTAVEPTTFQAPDLDITPAEFVGPDVTDITDVAPAVDTEQEVVAPALAFGAPTGGRGEVERAVPRTPEGFVPEEEEQPGERRVPTMFTEERVRFELPTVGELI